VADDLLAGNTFDLTNGEVTRGESKSVVRDFDSKKILLKMLDGTMITGRTNLHNNTRLSDLLNRESDLFIVVFDAPFRGQDEQIVFVNKTQIMWAMPVDD